MSRFLRLGVSLFWLMLGFMICRAEIYFSRSLPNAPMAFSKKPAARKEKVLV
jgi:hypothetical protein